MTDVDPLSGVAVFVAVARLGSFTRAAEQLGVTKSAVGKSVARLEARLGVKLLHRTTRLMHLTEDGEAYLAACAAAMDDIVAAESALRSSRQVLQGRLRVDMPVAFGRQVLLPILLEICEPHADLSLTLTFNDATIDPLVEDVDLVIHFGVLRDSSHLVARRLAVQDRVICAAPRYLERHGVPVTLEDLSGHHGIVGSPKGPPLHWVVNDGGQIRKIAPPATHQLGDGDAIIAAAVGGFGLCQMPSSLVRDHIESGRLTPVLSDLSTVPVEIHAVWPKQAHLSPRVRFAVDQLVAYAARGCLN